MSERVFHPGDIVSHFKRETVDPATKKYLYKIIGVSTHSETREKYMNYQALYDECGMYIRPYDMFMSEVDHEKYPDIKQKYRFELCPSAAAAMLRDASVYRAELTGVFGDPVDDNPTGVMEEAAYAAEGLNFRYLTMRVLPENLGDAMMGMRACGMKGVNLTMPHKINVIPYLDELTEAADIIGAVNTVINDGGKLIGENTDGKGFTIALANNGVELSGKKVTILGAGGAAKAIAVECALKGAASVTVINRTAEHGQALASLIEEKTPAQGSFLQMEDGMKVPEGTDLLINATSIGLKPEEDRYPDIDYSTITENMVVCDVVFNPEWTIFLRKAREQGATVYSGLGMLVQQGAINFELWTGKQAPIDVMIGKLKEEFK